MRIHFYLLVCFILTSVSAYTQQQAILHGRVTDKDNLPLSYVTVSADSFGVPATLTDSNGDYQLNIQPGKHEIQFNYIGFRVYKVSVTLLPGESEILNAVMHAIILDDDIDMIVYVHSTTLDQVVITGTRYETKLGEETVSMDVVKGNMLTNENIVSADGIMNHIPGVTIADGQVNIRGGSGWSYGAGSRAQVMLDDLPLLSADAQDAKWEIVPVENLEQVEVIKGAGSALYGTGALDGVVNMRTAYPTDEPYVNVTAYSGIIGPPTRTPDMNWWGSNDPLMGGASFAYRQKFGQGDLVMGGATNVNTGYLDSSDAHSIRYNIKYRYRFKKIAGLNMGINASVYYDWGKSFFLWKGIDSLAYLPYPGTVSIYKNYRFTVDPFIDYTDSHGDHFRFSGRYLDSRNANSTNQGSVPDEYYSELQYHRPFKFNAFDLNVVGGVVNVFDNVVPPANATGSLFGKNSLENFSVYGQTDFKFFRKLTISLGARWEYFDMRHYIKDSATGSEVLANNQNSLNALPYPVFRAGANYQVADKTFLRASFGQGFRYPSIAERYISTSVGPLTIASNPNLQPEKGYDAEVGIKQGFNIGDTWTGYIDASGFLNHYNNMVEFTFGQFGPYSSWNNPAQDFGFGFSSQNIGKAQILGTEVELSGQGKIGPVQMIILTGYTYLDPRSLDWNSPLHLYNYQDSMLTNKGVSTLAFNPANNPKSVPYITYGQTSSSTQNVLKYTSKHTFKLDLTLDWKGIELNNNLQFQSFQQNIDYAFVSPLFTQYLGTPSQTAAFTGLEQYIQKKENTPIGKGRGDIVWNLYAAYNFKQGVRVAFLINNVLNWEYTLRPAYYQSPRNYTVQLSYTLKGKVRK